MLRNYLKIGLRNLLKQKGYSFINISGLAVGIACCLLIFLYVKDEVTYDSYHAKKDRIFRIISSFEFSGNHMTMAATNFVEAAAYAQDIPEVEAFARLEADAGIVKKGDEYIQQQHILYADAALLDIFDFDLVAGNFDGALTDLNKTVITEEMALKYFGKKDAVGESLLLNVDDSFETYFVEAVIANHPSNSSFNFRLVLPWQVRARRLSERRLNSWSNISMNSVLLLTKGADIPTVEAKMKEVRYARNPYEDDEWARAIENSLQPLTDIHLNTDIEGNGNGMMESGEAGYSYILSGIALIILIVACINFINLSMARSFPRAREIGVRKVLGAHKKQIALQFLNEALVMCMIAFVLGLLLTELALPVFEELTQKKFTNTVIEDPILVAASFVLILLVALFSGFYPSFVLSRFNVVKSLKGRIRLNTRSTVSKVLVVVQFSIAAVLMIGTIAMNRQIDYMVNVDLGYDDENLVKISTRNTNRPNLVGLFRAALADDPNILGVAGSDDYGSGTGAANGGVEFMSVYSTIDDQYLDLINAQLLQGRNLKKGDDRYLRPNASGGTDTLWNVLVNETFVKRMAWEEPLNKISDNQYRVVGVLKDFNFASAKQEIGPVMWVAANEREVQYLNSIYVKFAPAYLPQVKTVLAETWSSLVPDRPFDFTFVEEQNMASYEEEARWRKIITSASVLAIIISCLGLFGLAHLTTQQRIKEIGIRKVLGARVSGIVLLLNSNFARLVLISILVAAPVAWYALQQWLQIFASRMELSVLIFLVPGLIIFGIAVITVSLQSLKTAKSNPIDALRYE
ncbi:MAG: ABC transporter permease [Roseivirga sp.]